VVERGLRKLGFELLTVRLGAFPGDNPLTEVYALARRCSGGVIMGFEQYEITKGTRKSGTRSEFRIYGKSVRIPSPWNQIEAGLLFGMRLPLLIFREEGVEGGIFAEGSSNTFVHPMPVPNMNGHQKEALNGVLLKWSAQARQIYYNFDPR
jgi:hypothetical protein